MTSEDKRSARDEIRRALRAMARDETALRSQSICRAIAALEAFKSAKVVMAYAPCALEVDIRSVVEIALDQGKKVCFPVITGKGRMKAVAWNGRDKMSPGEYGILRPPEDEETYPETIDLVIAPGLAFDRGGGRLGKGGGFYDRFLPRCKAVVVAPAFSEQVVDKVPADERDIRIDILVTDKGVIICER